CPTELGAFYFDDFGRDPEFLKLQGKRAVSPSLEAVCLQPRAEMFAKKPRDFSASHDSTHSLAPFRADAGRLPASTG
ncbi:MAG: hypothetical protein ACREP1_08150, partial [Rhodanobacteraceae bacterium]